VANEIPSKGQGREFVMMPRNRNDVTKMSAFESMIAKINPDSLTRKKLWSYIYPTRPRALASLFQALPFLTE
jgi:hypothetical protein